MRVQAMIPPAFEYLRPKTIPEAIAFLLQHGEDAKILSGGQSLIPFSNLCAKGECPPNA
jgi:aerobic carbon-monoxide dehydrogenase medium subunit